VALLQAAPASRAASRATSPVPVAMSSTVMPGRSPARRNACRRYQAPVPSEKMLLMRS
jgi:hypothetical protein